MPTPQIYILQLKQNQSLGLITKELKGTATKIAKYEFWVVGTQ